LSKQVVDGLLAEEVELTAEMAVRLELAFGRSAESWLSLQTAHSLKQARKKVDPASVRPFVFPARENAA
jgi:addiction module HigA family antidote